MIRNAVQILEQSNCLPFTNNFSWLQNVAPTFSLHGEQVSILHKPEEFYQTLLDRCKKAQKRIMLASLYLGTGPLEKELVHAIESQMDQIKNLKVNILLDANRGSRGKENSRTMLMPLVKNEEQCKISLFHTPSLRGPLKYLLPARYNELVGLQHMKLYLFDDSIIISGANLSEDYFTNRQDRYIMISECKDLADFYWDLIQHISDVSLELDKSDNLTPRAYHPFKSSKRTYVDFARSKIWGYYENRIMNNKSSQNKKGKSHDTLVFPLLELPPLGVHQDSHVTERVLEAAEEGSKVTVSTGYFNLTDQYASSILYRSQAYYRILMAHPSANGFLKARGLASGIPSAYTGLALRFFQNIKSTNASERVIMLEYARPGWTFHAKGLWYTPIGESSPLLTLVGSSNFGSRSVRRDLEMQAAILTTNPSLRKRLAEEETSLIDLSSQFNEEVASDPNRKPALWKVVQQGRKIALQSKSIAMGNIEGLLTVSFFVGIMIHQGFVLICFFILLSQVSTNPVHCNEINNLLEGKNDFHANKRQADCSPILQEEAPTGRPRILSEEDRKKLQTRLFEGLLHFGTVVNHIDTFIMDKSRMILKSLGKMATSEEDPRFDI
ncbi:CDP-diacylglycerol--glycerol-3-phosphate 3-phosphatidyltransferase, mitochondrial isoform X2 [Halyomorpha halys]|uniref:CDP-diacylglycerol--glycerol-3-phosphate 3-phosphatidyltransferase, mitochondrial isoform X2 n=1 Tax=Halyomorpha halys TaxID=286706 RepID=UPI000D0C9087|nr:CDP-diacylglycerol--glycerol-3-phosphate 3-phosphatidyltransferase, mitochondrial isoform X2 [Halyomorpha halys]